MNKNIAYKVRKAAVYITVLAVIPLAVYFGTVISGGKKYAFMIFVAAILSLAVFFVSFEKRKNTSQRLSLIAVMTALSIVGRLAFSFFPSFKPVTAMVIICGMFLGGEAGFMCGSLSALISNFYFGQGAWTPFQMFSWGIVGFAAGLLGRLLRKNTAALLIYGFLGGALYSFILDVWTVIWYDGYFNVTRYIAVIISSAPTTVIYSVSNVVFLLLLAAPFGKKLERIKTKYGI